MRAIALALTFAVSSPAAADRPHDVWCGTPWADTPVATTPPPGVDLDSIAEVDLDLDPIVIGTERPSFAARLAERLAGELRPPVPPVVDKPAPAPAPKTKPRRARR